MAIALDASTPNRWSGTWADVVTGGSVTIGAGFTAPANALLVVAMEYDTNGGASGTQGAITITDSGGLTWTARVERQGTETVLGGGSGIFTARTTSAVSRTVTMNAGTCTGATNWGTKRGSATCYVFTGVDVDGTPVDTVGASNEGTSSTDNLTTTSVTPGADGVLVAAGCEWNTKGACTSSDLKGVDSIAGSNHAEYAGAIDVIDGWKVCTSGVGVTGNLDAGGASPQWKWCQIIVRATAGGAAAQVPYQPNYWNAPMVAQ